MSESLAILVCNRKGGVGKTTVATHLAAMFAARGWRTALLDCDPQLSACHWARGRSDVDRLAVINAQAHSGVLAPAIRLRIPPNAECLIYDAPAGPSAADLSDLLRRVHLVLVPVMPSTLDLAASEEFIRSISRTPELRNGRARLALIANRVREGQISTRNLRRTLPQWNVPVLAELHDSQLYVLATAMNRAVHEFRSCRAAAERETWSQLYDRIFKLTGTQPRPRTLQHEGSISYLFPPRPGR